MSYLNLFVFLGCIWDASFRRWNGHPKRAGHPTLHGRPGRVVMRSVVVEELPPWWSKTPRTSHPARGCWGADLRLKRCETCAFEGRLVNERFTPSSHCAKNLLSIHPQKATLSSPPQFQKPLSLSTGCFTSPSPENIHARSSGPSRSSIPGAGAPRRPPRAARRRATTRRPGLGAPRARATAPESGGEGGHCHRAMRKTRKSPGRGGIGMRAVRGRQLGAVGE